MYKGIQEIGVVVEFFNMKRKDSIKHYTEHYADCQYER
jgi:hypothetical protein